MASNALVDLTNTADDTPSPSAKRIKLTHGAATQLDLLVTGKFSDFLITCHGTKLEVHRAILLGHSQYLDTLINGSFKEATEMKVDLPEEEIELLVAVLAFIYTKVYPGKALDSALTLYCPELAKLVTHEFSSQISLFEVADRYLVPEMKKAALATMRDKILEKTPAQLRTSSDFEEAVKLMQENETACLEMRAMMAWAVVHVTNGEDEYEKWDSFCEENPSFGYALLKEKGRTKITWRCENLRVSGCQEKKRAIMTVLVQSSPTTAIFRSCACDFRGLCSDGCYVDPKELAKRRFKQITAYCNHCVDTGSFALHRLHKPVVRQTHFRLDDEGCMHMSQTGINVRLTKGTCHAEVVKDPANVF